MNNLADMPDCAALVAELEGVLGEWIEKTEDPFDSGERIDA